jgi:flagellar hook-basal body complex protein FliE
MMVTGVGSLLPTSEAYGPTPVAVPGGFGQRLESALDRVNAVQLSADDALSKLAAGGDVDLHGSMIALSEAEIALRATVAVRDKLVAAYDTLFNLAV